MPTLPSVPGRRQPKRSPVAARPANGLADISGKKNDTKRDVDNAGARASQTQQGADLAQARGASTAEQMNQSKLNMEQETQIAKDLGEAARHAKAMQAISAADKLRSDAVGDSIGKAVQVVGSFKF